MSRRDAPTHLQAETAAVSYWSMDGKHESPNEQVALVRRVAAWLEENPSVADEMSLDLLAAIASDTAGTDSKELLFSED